MPSLLSPVTLSVALCLILGQAGYALDCYQCEVANCEVVTCDATLTRPACYDARANMRAGVYGRASGCIDYGSCLAIERNMAVIVENAKEKYGKSGLETFMRAFDLRVKVLTCCETDLCNIAEEKVQGEEQQENDQQEAYKSEL